MTCRGRDSCHPEEARRPSAPQEGRSTASAPPHSHRSRQPYQSSLHKALKLLSKIFAFAAEIEVGFGSGARTARSQHRRARPCLVVVRSARRLPTSTSTPQSAVSKGSQARARAAWPSASRPRAHSTLEARTSRQSRGSSPARAGAGPSATRLLEERAATGRALHCLASGYTPWALVSVPTTQDLDFGDAPSNRCLGETAEKEVWGKRR